jgi:predicted chitinase
MAASSSTRTAARFTPERVAALFPGARREAIATHLPLVLEAMAAEGLEDPLMALVALATIRAETAGFLPIDEAVSSWNTPPDGPPYALYDHRADLGNQGPGDGAAYRGRGFVQLTGRDNYRRIGQQLGIDLEANPELANEPRIAARILAAFLKQQEPRLRAALALDDLAAARRAVNGGSHGLAAFTSAYRAGQALLSAPAPTRSQQVGATIPACDTGLIHGLSQQVLDRLIQRRPELLQRLDHPLLQISGAHNNPWLQRAAAQALIRAVEERGVPLRINSALRTPMQQYLLHQQYRRDLCGVMAAAPPPHSNHNSGLAIDIDDAQAWRPVLERHGWRWIGAFDPMHFDYVGGGDDLGALQVEAFQELWNHHHPEAPLAVDGLWGPATAAAVDRSPSAGFGNGPILRRGMLGVEVAQLQTQLRQALALTPEQLAADGHYGPATEAAVRRFQQQQGLADDGIAGPATLAALTAATGPNPVHGHHANQQPPER